MAATPCSTQLTIQNVSCTLNPKSVILVSVKSSFPCVCPIDVCNVFHHCLGYSIFVVFGELPPCTADEALLLRPAVQTQKPRLLSEVVKSHSQEDDSELQKAIRMSLGQGLFARPFLVCNINRSQLFLTLPAACPVIPANETLVRKNGCKMNYRYLAVLIKIAFERRKCKNIWSYSTIISGYYVSNTDPKLSPQLLSVFDQS